MQQNPEKKYKKGLDFSSPFLYKSDDKNLWLADLHPVKFHLDRNIIKR